MDKDIIDKMYESFPDSDEFDSKQQFDAFLIGDGSAQLMQKVDKGTNNSSQQLTGIYSVNDLYKEPQEDSNIVQDDLADFDQEEIPLRGSYDDFFFLKKKDYLDKFGFLEEKSKIFKGRPIRERDLVINEEDGYLLHYMKMHGYASQQRLNILAQLSSCKDMGFTHVKFSELDHCPMCVAYEGTVHKVSDLISRLGSGQTFIHKGCNCEFVPIISSRDQFKDIQNGLTLSAYIGEVYFKCLPLEFVDFMTSEFIEKIPYKEVVFVDFSQLKERDVKRFKVTDRDVVIDLGETLWIRNSYVLHYSPIDFLNQWLDCLNAKAVEVDEVSQSNGEILYLNGKKVIEKAGNYVDVETGEVVNLLGGE